MTITLKSPTSRLMTARQTAKRHNAMRALRNWAIRRARAEFPRLQSGVAVWYRS